MAVFILEMKLSGSVHAQGSRKVGHLKTTLGFCIFSYREFLSYSYSLLFNHILLLSLYFACDLWPFLIPTVLTFSGPIPGFGFVWSVF